VRFVRAAVRGVGLWRPAPGAETPPRRLPPGLHRRSSLLINMVAEVAAQATLAQGISLAQVPLVTGSAFGEIGTTLDILCDLEGDGILSPAQFQTSVHNTAVAYLSIAHGNRLASTSIAAGDQTVAMVLVEAFALLTLRGGAVLVTVADEALPEVLGAGSSGAVAAAWLLEAAPASAEWAGRPPLAILEDLGPPPAAPPGTRPRASNSPCEAGARLVEAIRAGRTGRIDLGPEGSSGWSLVVRRIDA
jgi:hypothetical protein